MRPITCSFLLGFLGACADSNTNLPAGWEAAERIEKLMQMTCSHSGLDDIEETLSRGDVTKSALDLTYEHAHFRCEQPVEGYLREHAGALEALVQPIDMDPDAVAGCDCLYTIEMHVPIDQHAHQITVFRRWDNLNSPNAPIRIGSLEF